MENAHLTHTIILDVRGMTCASCVARVERALEQTPGVAHLTVNYATEIATASLLPDADPNTLLTQLTQAVQSAGYDVAHARIDSPTPQQSGAAHRHHARASAAHNPSTDSISSRRAAEALAWRQRWLFGLAITLPITAMQMAPMWLDWHIHGPQWLGLNATIAYLTTLVLLYTGRPFFQGAWSSLRHRAANMDTLIALGAGVAMLYSIAIILREATSPASAGASHIHPYFDCAAQIVTLISIGKWMEARARGRAGQALESLLELGAQRALVDRDGTWQELDIAHIHVGDLFLTRPGDKIALDGVVCEGAASVDESMWTGEPIPVKRSIGDEVFGGTINTDGRLVIRATRVGADMALAQIAAQVEQAQAAKANIQRLADRISAIFVPVVLLLSLLTFAAWWWHTQSLWQALSPAIALLVVACPCALGLATPTALMIGSTRGAKQGILLRDVNALELVSRLDAVVFDKTGTLTHGKPSLITTHLASDAHTPTHPLAIAAALEASSSHPIARAITTAAHQNPESQHWQDLPITDFASTAGEGVSATIQGQLWRLGRVSWITQSHPDIYNILQKIKDDTSPKTWIALANADHIVALFGLEDTLKPEAAHVVQTLHTQGVEVWLVTGDEAHAAHHIAKQVGIDPKHVRSSVRPNGKAAEINALKAQRDGTQQQRVVAMIGDGINDSPALASADLGIALGSGAHVAIEAAAIVLVKEDLRGVTRALRLARLTYGKIKQNLFWALLYNTLLIPIAALGLLHPTLAAAAMALSSVSVVTSSLLLLHAKLERVQSEKEGAMQPPEILIDVAHDDQPTLTKKKAW